MYCYYFNSVSYCSHYFIVIINATVQDTLSAASLEDDMLRPHNSSRPYYVAAVLRPNEYRPAMPFVLGNSRNTSFEGIRYQNVPLTLGTYRYFVRAFTIGPVSSYKLSISYHTFVHFTQLRTTLLCTCMHSTIFHNILSIKPPISKPPISGLPDKGNLNNFYK